MAGGAWIFFLLFAAVMVFTYLGIRRQWMAPSVIAGISVLASITTMTLLSLAQENSLFQAVVVGILVGGLFSGATLAVAWYFHSNELRAKQAEMQDSSPQDDSG
jgi:Na+/H+-translocating membrane pyrophosphatase